MRVGQCREQHGHHTPPEARISTHSRVCCAGCTCGVGEMVVTVDVYEVMKNLDVSSGKWQAGQGINHRGIVQQDG